MRVVLDTNTVVSGLISPRGAPRLLLDAARAQSYDLCTSATLLAELLDVISRPRFAVRLSQAGLTPQTIVADIRRLAGMFTPGEVPRVIEADPDDDHVLACALAARADFIISGDKHLHSLGGQYRGISILTPADALTQIRG